MEHTELVEQIAVALGFGLLGGLGARLIGLSPIVGYLAAGMVISPFTPGYEGDVATLQQLAEIGVIFLMFGVGLHFNIRDLLAVRTIAVPGAIAQMAAVTALGVGVGTAFGLDWRESLVLGLALAISSTVVMVRALEDRGLLPSIHGRVGIGWLVVQDFATVLFLAILPALASGGPATFAREATIDLAVAGAFLAVMLVLGAKLMPRLLALVARLGSRELFILAVVASAMGIAAGAAALGISVALGAFVAGVVISEHETSHQAASDVIPLREAFAVLFFVAVGMLLDPAVLRDHLGLVLAVAMVAVVGKGLLSAGIGLAFPFSASTALLTGAGLAQLGEFSFVIAQVGLQEELVRESTYNVILAAAIVSITVNPLAFASVPVIERALRRVKPLWRWADRQGEDPGPHEPISGHVVIAGYGRVGELTGHSLAQLGVPYRVLENDLALVRRLNNSGVPAIWGDAATLELLAMAHVDRARLIVICVPDESTSLLTIANARKLNPSIPIIVRARHREEIAVLMELGATEVVVPEYEGGLELMRQTLVSLGYDDEETLRLSRAMRDLHYGIDH